MSKKKVLFILPSLGGGGAERVILTLLTHLDPAKFCLHLAAANGEGAYSNRVPKGVVFHDLRAKRVRNALFPLIRLAWKERFSVVFSTLGYLNIAILLTRFLFPPKTSFIVREGNTVSAAIHHVKNRWLWKWLYLKVYPLADTIICQSDSMKNDLCINFRVPEAKIERIYNPVDADTISALSTGTQNPYVLAGPGPHLVSVGRLTYQKNYSVLLDQVPLWLAQHPNLRLWILGDGELKEQLAAKVSSLKLCDVVTFLGFQENPYPWIKYADLLVMSSFYEGLPNVLLEAISLGCPVIATKSAGGVAEIMELCNLQKSYVAILPKKLSLPAPKGKISQEFNLFNVVDKYTHILLRA